MNNARKESKVNREAIPCKTPIEDLRRGALAHYEKISMEAQHWLNVIPIAINEHFDRLIERGEQ